jgi:tetratricopeptide (TPR) repeat protein
MVPPQLSKSLSLLLLLTSVCCGQTDSERRAALHDAIRDYDEAIRLDPQNAVTFTQRGIAKRNLEDFAGAIRDYDEAIRLDPNYAIAYNSRGWSKYLLKDFTGAMDDLDEAIRLDPKFALAYNNRGLAKRNLEDYVGAIGDYDAAIRLDPNYAGAYNNRGWCKHVLKDYAGAIRDYDKESRVNPQHSYWRINTAFLLSTAEKESLRNPLEALKLAEEVLRADNNNAYALSAKSCALAARGDFQGAIALQRSISDATWQKDDGIDGGTRSKSRLAAWESGKLWHP